MDPLLIIIFYFLTAYLAVYLLYIYLLIFSAARGRLSDLRKKNLSTSVQRKISVIVYSQNNLNTILELVNALSSQDYPKDKYTINIILDNNTDNSEKILEFVPDIKMWKISTNDIPIGMYPSVSWLLEKLVGKEYTNGYVILAATNVVKANFLSRVNIALEDHDISQACIATKFPYSSVFNTLGYINSRIENRIYNAGLHHLGTGCKIMPSGLIARPEFLEEHPLKVPLLKTELDYNFELIKAGVKVRWAPEVLVFNKIADDIQDSGFWKANRFVKHFQAIKNNIRDIVKSKIALNFAFFMLTPSRMVQIFILSLIVLSLSVADTGYYNLYTGVTIAGILFALSLMADVLSLAVTRSKLQDFKVWLIGSVFYINEFVVTLSYITRIMKVNTGLKEEYSSLGENSKMQLLVSQANPIVDVVVTDGKKNLKCKLEIKTDNDEYQLIFMFRDKKFTTRFYPFVDQAYEELNKRLEARNFKMVSCFNCGYFNYSKQSHSDSSGEEGHCFYNKEGQQISFDEVVKAWHSCEQFADIANRNDILNKWRDSLPEQ